LELVAFVAVQIGVTAYLVIFGVSHLYDVQIGRDGVDVLLLKTFKAATIKFNSIESAYERYVFSFADQDEFPRALFSIPLVNRFSFKMIILKRRSGIFRYVAMTPKNKSEFLISLRQRLASEATVSAQRTG
jgi:hypothetical protein